MEYATNAKGNLGVTLGAIGTGLGILGGMPLVNGMATPTNGYVTKDAYDVQLQLIDAQKQNAILAADLASEKKMVEVFNAANNRINDVRDELNKEIRCLERKVDDNAAAQSVINANYGSQLTLNNSQIAQLFSLTKFVIPNASVCPGWES